MACSLVMTACSLPGQSASSEDDERTTASPSPTTLAVREPTSTKPLAQSTEATEDGYPRWSMVGVATRWPETVELSVLDFGAVPDDGQSDSAAFARAIAAARSGTGSATGPDETTVINVPAGDFVLTETLRLETGVVIRGPGHNGSLVIDLAGRDEPGIVAAGAVAGEWVPLNQDVEPGASTLEVANPGPFAVGQIVEIEQQNDAQAMNTMPEWEVDWGEGSVGELNRIVAIDDATITLASPVNGSLSTVFGVSVRPVEAIEQVGLENLTIVRRDDGYGDTVLFSYAANVWISGVHSQRTTRAHMSLNQVYRCQIDDSIVHGASDFGDGGRAYGISLARHATNCLVINSTLYDLRHAIIIQLGASGNVIAYNDARGSAGYADRQPRADLSLHGHWPQANLFEGNVFDRVVFADWWGPSGPGNTLFRSCVLVHVIVADQSNDQNLVGNVIGQGGLTIEPDISGTRLEANLQSGAGPGSGSEDTTEQPGSVDASTVPPSLWLTERPDILDGLWPPVQPELGLAACRIPASAFSPFGS